MVPSFATEGAVKKSVTTPISVAYSHYCVPLGVIAYNLPSLAAK